MTNENKKATIDWETMKAEYFKSPEVRVADFIRRKLEIEAPSAFHKRKTKGWTEEKKKLLESSLEGAKQELENKIKDAYEVPIEQLNNLKKGIFDILFARLSQITSKVKVEIDPNTWKKQVVVMGDIPTKELVDILKVVKTEMWEPTNINQSQLGDEEKKIAREIGSIKII